VEVEAPAPQLEQRPLQAAAQRGQLVGVDRGRRLELDPLHDARLLEVAQTLGEHVGGRAADRPGQLREAQRPEDELADDQQRPALADLI
jgi:hypothetical protein